MAKKIAPQTYTYRQHQLVHACPNTWLIAGPAVNGDACTIREAMDMIDQAPGAPRKLNRKEAGKLGAKVFYSRYTIQPANLSGYAIIEKTTGRIVNFLAGRPGRER